MLGIKHCLQQFRLADDEFSVYGFEMVRDLKGGVAGVVSGVYPASGNGS